MVDGRRRRGKTQVRRLSAGWGLALGLCALLGFPSRGLAGMLDTPLPTFSDGKSAQVVGLLPRVIKKDNLETVVVCTNLDTVAANIGLEVFDKGGVLVNSVNAGNGEILNVAVGATRTIGTGRPELLTVDHRILMIPVLANGSGRVVASERDVFCHAMVVDEVHVIVEPSICPTCQVPTLVSAPVWACGNSILDPFEECDDGNAVGGDGCEGDCTAGAPPICGDSVVTAPETCDPPGSSVGGNGNLCRGDCTVCGDSVVDAGEECDDGNGINGDGCGNDCKVTVTTTVCSATPLVGCLPPAASGKSQLQIKDQGANGPGPKDKIQWKWFKGPSLTQADFGDPLSSNGAVYKFCVYAGATPSVVVAMQVPAGGTCSGKPCWRALGTKGYRYGDRRLSSDGVKKLILKGGAAGKSKILIQGKDGNLPLPTLPLGSDGPLIAQLSSSDPNAACFEQSFSQAHVTRNEAKQLNARAP